MVLRMSSLFASKSRTYSCRIGERSRTQALGNPCQVGAAQHARLAPAYLGLARLSQHLSGVEPDEQRLYEWPLKERLEAILGETWRCRTQDRRVAEQPLDQRLDQRRAHPAGASWPHRALLLRWLSCCGALRCL